MPDDLRHFEDFRAGEVIHLGKKTVSRQEIVDYAREFDAQPMHLDDAAGRASLLGGLSASGWHTASMVMRLMVDTVMLRSTSLGAPGLDRLSWLRPVRPDDTIHAQMTVVSARRSVSKPHMGVVHCAFVITNQHGEQVLEMEGAFLFGARDTRAAA